MKHVPSNPDTVYQSVSGTLTSSEAAPRKGWQKIRRSNVVHNVAALLGTQIATYAFPLLTIPYLARVLGPFHWGMVAFSQSLGLYVSMIVDFGFQLSATRRVARLREEKGKLEEIVAGVLGAKILLALVCLVVLVVCQQYMLSFQKYGLILWAGVFSGIGQGFSMLWFYQGLEKMKLPAGIDFAGKGLATAGIFLFVHRPEDAWKVLGLQCVCYCSAALVLFAMTYRKVRFHWPTRQGTWESMHDSSAMFLFRSSVSLYTTANALILGSVATPIAVAFYAGAERIIKALLNLLTPLSQSLYPRMSRLLTTDRQRAIWLARLSLIVMSAGGILISAGAFAAAPLIIRVVLGPGYQAAIPVLRVLSLLAPAIAVSTVLGIQWMLPLGLDAAYNKIIISAGLLNLFLALMCATRWQAMGMAWSVVISEYVVTGAVCLVLLKRNISPTSDRSVLSFNLNEQMANSAIR